MTFSVRGEWPNPDYTEPVDNFTIWIKDLDKQEFYMIIRDYASIMPLDAKNFLLNNGVTAKSFFNGAEKRVTKRVTKNISMYLTLFMDKPFDKFHQNHYFFKIL